MNPGGLYGKATPDNFPYVNDYRNGVVAEGMKVLGFVNRYSRGVQTVQEELKANGNGEAEFKLNLGTAFLVIENISVYTCEKVEEKNGEVEEKEERVEEKVEEKEERVEEKVEEKEERVEEKKFLSESQRQVVDLMKANPFITYDELMEVLHISQNPLYKRIKKLKELKVIERKDGRKKGRWIVKE